MIAGPGRGAGGVRARRPELASRRTPGGRVARAGRARGDQRRAPPRSSPASAWRSTSSGRLSGVATLTARYVRGRRGHGRAHPRHAQDHAGTARAREGGRAGRRRGEPPQRAVRRDPRQGEPRRPGGRRGGGHAARAGRALREGVTVEVECATLDEVEAAVAAGVPRILLDNMAPTSCGGPSSSPAGAPSSRPRAGSRSTRVRAVAETGRGLHQRRRAHALGARARRQPAARPDVGGRSTANGSVTASSREPKR